jgi:glutathionyl-hydroquinone reductase
LEALYYYLATKQDEQIVRAINGAIQGNYSSSFYSLFVSEYTQAMERANIGAYNSAVVGAVGYYAAKAKPYNLQFKELFTKLKAMVIWLR